MRAKQQTLPAQANATGPDSLSQGTASQALEEVPVLWAASAALVPPLQARLQAHFAPTTAAGRLDQPEWLFQTVLRLVQEHVGHVACLQPGLESAGLSGHCHMAVEYARAMRDATKAVLRTARLPALQELWDQDQEEVAGELWRQQVREAIEFEAKLAPFLGAPQGVLATRVLPDPLLAASVLRAITDDPEYMAVWIAAERQSALARLQEVMGDPKAWMPPPPEEDDQQAGPGILPAPHAQGGWQQEFNPPRVAEVLMDIISSVVDISRSTPNAEAQKALLDGAGGPILEAMTERLSERLEQAAASNSILSEAWAPRVGACVAAARYLHHMALPQKIPARSECLIRYFRRKQNILQLRAAVGYKEAVESADSYPTHSGAAGTVTPILEPAMALLQAGLHALAPALDGPSFRDIWRAVTVPVNRFLFNYVATEAYFSPAGAHQEMLAAARLLTLGDQDTQEVVRKASTQAAMGEPLWREPWLAQLGVGCLSAQQVIAVVERRV
ncbi:TIP-1 family-domain-containing protein [Dunaliella salina]|uniref:TIP-1 family-domain-containing protein n=1 Tax=Dunaliella salina TaxID=3046 RepID=A0ABQ7GHN4_DUNSA|nr:TIP-1 family-domain-containing protein [Dunaliella salina]|eukprot:KAF5834092.1 TIP-1 family-domain-containing protein [Dunaliella salina]